MKSEDHRLEGPSSGHEETALKDRRGRRVPLNCRMFFFGDDEFEGEGQLVDVSANGCRATSTVHLSVGMKLKLSIFLPDHNWPLRVDEAIVRWIAGENFGIEFTVLREAQRERLRSLVIKVK